jgi:elongation factor Tu
MAHVNTIVLGPREGAVALATALSGAAGDARGGSAADPAQLERLGQSEGLGVVAFRTAGRSYSLVVPAREFELRAFLQLAGMADGAILLGRGTALPAPEVCQQLFLLPAAGVTQLAAVSEAQENSPEPPGRLPLNFNAWKLVTRAGFAADDVPVVSGPLRGRGSARLADRLLRAMEEGFVPRRPDVRGPFLFAVEGVFDAAGRGVVATGTVLRGTVRAGDGLELLGAGTRRAVRCGAIEALDGALETARGGDNVGLLLDGVAGDQVRPGTVVGAPGTLELAAEWKARVTVLTPEEGAASEAPRAGWRGSVIVGRAEEPVTVRAVGVPLDTSARKPQRIAGITARPVPIGPGLPAIFHSGGRVAAVGRVAD